MVGLPCQARSDTAAASFCWGAKDVTARHRRPQRRNESNFRWADNSTAFPALIPSSQDYNGPDYSHWVKAGSNAPEPNGQACAYAGDMAYYYFRGMVPGDRVLSGFIQAGGSKDVFGWVDVQCDYETISLHYICEFEGKAWFWGARGRSLPTVVV